MHRYNKTVTMELKHCNLGSYDAEEAHRNSLQKRKTVIKCAQSTNAVSGQAKSSLGLGFILEQIAGCMKL
ncbi:MAG: hypothetical protein QS748_11380 [Candidatus Endonucleobacter bathymodioli]|uniref:Uncharacterized protein n=1 Tax=Candidatus Endonucleibacter bathymodioli TaxID=539814 RepID=A0AA90NVD3_9GAMM|nr:hypothetical protein [Candidatus Endonucleobacter bathymodioli]